MPTSSIGGLVSGLETATIINQLMQLEAAPQTKLKSQLSKQQLAVNSLQTFNSQMAGLATKAKELADPATWSPLKATSSQAGVSVTAGNAAPVGTFSVQVDRLATQHKLRFDDAAALGDVVVGNGTTVQLTLDGTTTTLDTGDGTLQGLVAALNASGTGVQATTVRQDDGSHRLVVQSTGVGAAQQFTLTDSVGGALLGGAVVTQAQDAQVTIDGIAVTSASNTFKDVVPGLTFTVSNDAVGKTADLTVARDAAAPGAAVKALIDQVNTMLDQVTSLTGYNATTKASGLLAGDTAVRAAGAALQQSLYPGGNQSMAPFGIQIDRYGKFTFDETTFAQALADDPAALAAAITGPQGFAARVEKVATGASDSVNGTLTSALQGRNSSVDRLKSGIEDWDRRLELRRTALERQFTALETALSKMQSQSSWLSSQISSLQANNG
ncbi:flagellar filament capping protein FliD [Nocardioides daejeonensis]|uniref:flagellar filament capping protein FliD n=1 Tax=Nocardioides daejeonensis TaxID=1046556 RepID=UPI000D7423AA|nr:flagellar filament capping protein FliD [Nocardioides daejeonensis]